MADNITVTPGTGATIAAENLGGALVQRVKVALGPVDTDNGDISTSNPMPVIGTGTAGTAATGVITVQGITSGTPIPISGSITATNLSIGATGATPPADATYAGASVTTSPPSYTTGQMNALSLNTSGGLRVDGSGVTQPVSGTVIANAGTGTFAISGTVTANAGTNLNTSALALDTSVNGLLVTQGSTTSGEKGPLVQGAVTTAAPTYTTAQTSPISMTTAGAVRVDATGTTQPISGTVTVQQSTGSNLHVDVDNFPATQAVTQSGSWTNTVTQATGTNLHTVVDSGTVSATQSGTWTNTVTQTTAANLNATVSIAAAQTLATVTTVGAVTAITNALPAGTNNLGSLTNITGTVSLPTGASTSANQTTANASLASIDTKTPVIGQTTQALSTPVIVPADLTSATGSITVQDTGSTSTVQANGQTVLSGAATAGSTFSVATNSYASAVVKISGTWTGSIQVETSSDNGVTWIGLPTHIVGGSLFILAYTANVQIECNLADRTNIRVRAPSAITGTVSVQFIVSYNSTGIVFVNNAIRITDGANSSVATPLTVLAASTAATTSNTSAVVAISPNSNSVRLSDGTNNAGTFGNITGAQFIATTPGETPFGADIVMGWDGTTHREINVGTDGSQQVVGNVADQSADSGASVKVGGVFNTALSALTNGERGSLQLDNLSRLVTIAAPIDGVKATYSAAIVDLTVAGVGPTDIFTLTGSATKTIRITRVTLTGSETTATQRDILLIKRSAANTGGTSTTQTNVPHDSTSAAGTATVRAYTANPTGLGAAVGNLRTRKVFIATTTTNSDELIFDFGVRPSQAIVVRGVAEVVALNLNGVAAAGSSFDIAIEWTEE